MDFDEVVKIFLYSKSPFSRYLKSKYPTIWHANNLIIRMVEFNHLNNYIKGTYKKRWYSFMTMLLSPKVFDMILVLPSLPSQQSHLLWDSVQVSWKCLLEENLLNQIVLSYLGCTVKGKPSKIWNFHVCAMLLNLVQLTLISILWAYLSTYPTDRHGISSMPCNHYLITIFSTHE